MNKQGKWWLWAAWIGLALVDLNHTRGFLAQTNYPELNPLVDTRTPATINLSVTFGIGATGLAVQALPDDWQDWVLWTLVEHEVRILHRSHYELGLPLLDY